MRFSSFLKIEEASQCRGKDVIHSSDDYSEVHENQKNPPIFGNQDPCPVSRKP